jgi:hypothetical protein
MYMLVLLIVILRSKSEINIHVHGDTLGKGNTFLGAELFRVLQTTGGSDFYIATQSVVRK